RARSPSPSLARQSPRARGRSRRQDRSGGLLGRLGGRLDKTGDTQMTTLGGEAVGKPGVAGVHTNQRLNLSMPWEGSRRTCQALEPDPGNLAVRDFRGASGTVRHGETVNPACNPKSGNGNPSPTARRARFLSRPFIVVQRVRLPPGKG